MNRHLLTGAGQALRFMGARFADDGLGITNSFRVHEHDMGIDIMGISSMVHLSGMLSKNAMCCTTYLQYLPILAL